MVVSPLVGIMEAIINTQLHVRTTWERISPRGPAILRVASRIPDGSKRPGGLDAPHKTIAPWRHDVRTAHGARSACRALARSLGKKNLRHFALAARRNDLHTCLHVPARRSSLLHVTSRGLTTEFKASKSGSTIRPELPEIF